MNFKNKIKKTYLATKLKYKNHKYQIAIAVIMCLFFLYLFKNSFNKENDTDLNEFNEAEQHLPYMISGKTAFIEVSFDRSLGRYTAVVVEANNTVLNSADIIKEVVANNPNLEKIILRIHTTCEDNYGYKKTHTDEIIFNSYEISEFRKYNEGKDIAYSCDLYYHKLNEFWDTCGQNPSSMVY